MVERFPTNPTNRGGHRNNKSAGLNQLGPTKKYRPRVYITARRKGGTAEYREIALFRASCITRKKKISLAVIKLPPDPE